MRNNPDTFQYMESLILKEGTILAEQIFAITKEESKVRSIDEIAQLLRQIEKELIKEYKGLDRAEGEE